MINALDILYSVPSAPRNPQITAIDKTILQLQWMEPELPNGIIQHYRVSIINKVPTSNIKTN